MMTKTTNRSSLMARLRGWLAFQLLRRGIELQVEARHGAYRTRSKQLWKGGLVRVDIPLPRRNGVTDTPFGRVSSQTAKALIDSFTGVEGEDWLNEIRPGPREMVRSYDNKRVCVLCGHEVKVI
jgi:hypothetical protein